MTSKRRGKPTSASTSGSFAPRSRPDGDPIDSGLLVEAVTRVASDLQLLSDYDRATLQPVVDSVLDEVADALAGAGSTHAGGSQP